MFCNGAPADAAVLGAALVNYGHFTSLQVRGGCAQGWALHLERLQQGTRALFDAVLDEAQLLGWLRQALECCGVQDASVRITVFSRAFDFRQPLRPVPVDVLVGIGAPAGVSAEARAVLPVDYQRAQPELKHVGTFPLFQQRRLAMRAGFDDVLFIDAGGRVSEGSTWNVAFLDGDTVVWPQASALRGTAQQLLVAGLERLGRAPSWREVRLAALADFSGAVACNATGLWPLARIGDQGFTRSEALLECLRQALAQTPWQPL
ncbi:aminotransferase class IV family protein [Stenotrophomonas sp. CPCC 101365]|uniref:Aminotransferase class IV family protein n=1 Tax=Stenotrophomonas mori TaxID=2871096 RepID=A0ABT0SDN9_9GAMM|nr:aminotransferase class IV family protein [Stenotrophomonas mori]MCL7713188.1 aminotransferase class IV family protein [Stenotrophomonas mori]